MKHLQELKNIKKAIPKEYNCYIVGSCTIKNVVPNDIDVLVLVDRPITREELRGMRKKFYSICPKDKFSLIFNWAKDNKRLKELFPYYDLQTDEYHYEDRDKMTFSEYDVLKMRLYNTRYKAKRFNKERAHG